MRIGQTCARVLTLFAAAGFVAGCAASAGPVTGASAAAGGPAAAARPLGPLYNVPPDMLRPDGTMVNGLLPMNPDDQS